MKTSFAWLAVGAALFAAGYVVAQQTAAPTVRRVVTKLDESARAVVMIDERMALARPRGPTFVGNLWVTDGSPPDFSSGVDRGKTKIGLMPPKGGSLIGLFSASENGAVNIWSFSNLRITDTH